MFDFEDKKNTTPAPGDKDYLGGIFTTRVYAPGKNMEITTKKNPKGEVEAVFMHDLILGIF